MSHIPRQIPQPVGQRTPPRRYVGYRRQSGHFEPRSSANDPSPRSRYSRFPHTHIRRPRMPLSPGRHRHRQCPQGDHSGGLPHRSSETPPDSLRPRQHRFRMEGRHSPARIHRTTSGSSEDRRQALEPVRARQCAWVGLSHVPGWTQPRRQGGPWPMPTSSSPVLPNSAAASGVSGSEEPRGPPDENVGLTAPGTSRCGPSRRCRRARSRCRPAGRPCPG